MRAKEPVIAVSVISKLQLPSILDSGLVIFRSVSKPVLDSVFFNMNM